MKDLTAILFVILIVAFYAAVLFIVPMVIDEVAKRQRRKMVGNLIVSAHAKSALTRKQIEILSADHRLTARDMQILLRNQFSAAVKASDEGRETRIKYFQDLYEELEKDEPFEGLPSDVRLHLERIRESIGKDKDLLMQPLASQLQDLNATNRRKEKWMWGLTIASFAAGVVGVIFGAIPYLASRSSTQTLSSSAASELSAANRTQGLTSQFDGPAKADH